MSKDTGARTRNYGLRWSKRPSGQGIGKERERTGRGLGKDWKGLGKDWERTGMTTMATVTAEKASPAERACLSIPFSSPSRTVHVVGHSGVGRRSVECVPRANDPHTTGVIVGHPWRWRWGRRTAPARVSGPEPTGTLTHIPHADDDHDEHDDGQCAPVCPRHGGSRVFHI